MESEDFRRFADLLPEALLLVSVEGRVVTANQNAGRLFLRAADDLRGRSLASLLADPHERVSDYLRTCARTREPVPGALTLMRSDGQAVPCRAEGSVATPRSNGTAAVVQLRVFPKADSPSRFALLTQQIGELNRQVAERKRAETTLQFQAHLLDVIEQSVIATDTRGTVIYWNRHAHELYGWTREEALGRCILDLTPTDASREQAAHIMRELCAGRSWSGEFEVRRKDGREFPIAITDAPIHDETGRLTGIIGVSWDITERRRAEERQAFLLAASDVLARSLERADTLQRVADLTVPLLADVCFYDVVAPDGSLVCAAWAHSDAEAGPLMSQLAAISPGPLDSTHPVTRALASRQPQLVPEVTEEWLGAVASDPAYGRLLRSLGPRSLIAVPLVAADRALGVLTLSYTASGRRYGPSDLDTAADLSHRVALAIENARLYREAEAARLRAEQAAREIEALNARLQGAMVETHHRVKNNLQIIAAMVDMQLLSGETVLSIDEMRRLGSQVHALAVVHDILTHQAKQDGEATTLSAPDILERLIGLIRQTAPACEFVTHLDECMLTSRQATGLALVVNEVVSNAIKYGRERVHVTLRAEGGTATLVVADDGRGFPPGFSPDSTETTGLALVRSLSRWDLSGEVAYGNRPEGGAEVRVRFPLVAGADARCAVETLA